MDVGVFDLLTPRWRAQANRFGRAKPGERATLVAIGLAGFLVWIGLFVLFGLLVGKAYQIEVFGPIITRRLLEMLLIGLFSLLCFSNTITAISSLYLSDDLELLLSLPVRRETFFYARLVDTLAQSSWMVVVFGLPIFTAYHLAYNADWTFPLVAALVLPGFVLIPAGFGISVGSLLVRGVPAQRVREAMVFVGLLALIGVVILLRLLRPERLLHAEDFESLAAYVAELQTPVPLFLPPRWAVDVVEASLRGKVIPWVELGLLFCGGFALVGLARWITTQVYDEARARTMSARQARFSRSKLLDGVLGLWTLPLPLEVRAIVIKDVKGFVRDPGQWSQVFVVGAIVVIAIVSAASMPTDFLKGPVGEWMREILSFGALSLVGFIMASLAVRFQFTAVSLEGRAFWLVRTAPLRPERLLLAKIWPGLLPMIVVGETMAVAIPLILGAGTFGVFVSVWSTFFLGLGISGLAVAVGAAWPDFKADSAARVAAGPSAMVFMLLALVVVFATSLLEVVAIGVSLMLRYKGIEPGPLEWAGLVLPQVAVAVLGVAGLVAPIRWGARKLWERELPNS